MSRMANGRNISRPLALLNHGYRGKFIARAGNTRGAMHFFVNLHRSIFRCNSVLFCPQKMKILPGRTGGSDAEAPGNAFQAGSIYLILQVKPPPHPALALHHETLPPGSCFKYLFFAPEFSGRKSFQDIFGGQKGRFPRSRGNREIIMIYHTAVAKNEVSASSRGISHGFHHGDPLGDIEPARMFSPRKMISIFIQFWRSAGTPALAPPLEPWRIPDYLQMTTPCKGSRGRDRSRERSVTSL